MQIANEHEEVLEAQRVRVLAGLKDAGIGKSIIARVIGRDTARSQTVIIDKGAANGLKPDSAVITPAGIIGRVIHSSNFYSIVQLITDSQSAIGVMVQSTRRVGIVKGTGGRDMDLYLIDDDSDLKLGDKFMTSGQDRIYPRGLAVGVIVSIGPPRELIKMVTIRPSADFGGLEEVLCITDHQENVDVIDPTKGPNP